MRQDTCTEFIRASLRYEKPLKGNIQRLFSVLSYILLIKK